MQLILDLKMLSRPLTGQVEMWRLWTSQHPNIHSLFPSFLSNYIWFLQDTKYLETPLNFHDCQKKSVTSVSLSKLTSRLDFSLYFHSYLYNLLSWVSLTCKYWLVDILDWRGLKCEDCELVNIITLTQFRLPSCLTSLPYFHIQNNLYLYLLLIFMIITGKC